MPKKTTLTLTLAAIAVGGALAGCGSSTSTAAGVAQAPSAGATQGAITTAPAASSTSSSTTTSATSTPNVPLPAALKTKPKVVVPAGPPPKHLVVKDLIKGTGPAATANSTVTVQYVGEDYKTHKVFDASWNHPGAKPLTDPLSNLIKGWQQGIPGMKVGGRRELIIPPSLGYGATAQPGIPANSTLVFVIDLHGVQ
jgi:peptidylprolyl isomerase